jgi:hypothetical protein
MTCHFGCKPRADAYWIRLGESGPSVCGHHHFHDPLQQVEIERVTDHHMKVHLDSLCAAHGVGTIQELRNLLNEGRLLGWKQ